MSQSSQIMCGGLDEKVVGGYCDGLINGAPDLQVVPKSCIFVRKVQWRYLFFF